MISHSAQKLASFTSMRYVSFTLIMLRGFMVASILGPTSYGLYAIVIMLQQQFSFFGLGVRESLSVRLANLESTGKEFFTNVSSAFWFCMLVIILLSLLSWIALPLGNVFGTTKYNLDIAFQLAGVTVGTEILANITRARGMLKTVMIAELSYALFSIFILWFISLSTSTPESLLYGLLFTHILIFLYYLVVHREMVFGSFSFTHLKEQVRLGIPMLIQTTCTTFVYSSGHYYLSFSNSVEQLSIYSFAFSLAIAAQLGVQTVLWAQFPAMVSVFGNTHDSDDSKRLIRKFEERVAKLTHGFLVICLVMMKLFLSIAISIFFPDFINSTAIVAIVFMALYWPILAVSEATSLLARKQFRKLYQSSGAAIIVLALSVLVSGFNNSLLESTPQGVVAATTVCFANFVLYCMLKYHGGLTLGYSAKEILFDICRTVVWVSILVGCYYSNLIFVPIALMLVMLLSVVKSNAFKRRAAA